MWIPLINCGRQLTIHSKVRERSEGHVALYEIVEVEFDQYKLKLLERNNLPVAEEVVVILNCTRLIRYSFEVEGKDAILQG